MDSTVRMILRDSSCARLEFEVDREAYKIIEEESLQLQMKLAIKWWMSVYLNQKWQLLEWQLCIISWLFNQPNWMIFWYMINFILQSLLVFHVYIWNLLCSCLTICIVVILNIGAQCYTWNLTLTSSKMTSVMPELTESRAGCLHSIWNIHSFIEFPWV